MEQASIQPFRGNTCAPRGWQEPRLSCDFCSAWRSSAYSLRPAPNGLRCGNSWRIPISIVSRFTCPHGMRKSRLPWQADMPRVVFAGESIAFGEGEGPDPGGHWLSQLADIGGPARLVERCVKWSFAVNTPVILPATIVRACQLAMTCPKGPVFVSLPLEFLSAVMPTNAAASAAYPAPPTVDASGLDKLTAM